jgi:hypothetical protein
MTPTQKAVKKYGFDVCYKARKLNSKDGEGPHAISMYLGLPNVSAANAAINAGRVIDNLELECPKCVGTGSTTVGHDWDAYSVECKTCYGTRTIG